MSPSDERGRNAHRKDSMSYSLFMKKGNNKKARAETLIETTGCPPHSTGVSNLTAPSKARIPPAPETSIIEDAVGLEYSRYQSGYGKSKGKGQAMTRVSGGSSALAPRSTGISKPKSVSLATQQQRYEENGLNISLHEKSGKRRQHARVSTTFRNKDIEAALDIVESYAGSDKRNQFKNEGKSKTFISNWIEMAETLALGANPHTKLTNADWAASEFSPPNGILKSNKLGKGSNGKNPKEHLSVDDDSGIRSTSFTKKKETALEERDDQVDRAKKRKLDNSANSHSFITVPTNDSSVSCMNEDKQASNTASSAPTAPTNSAIQQTIHDKIYFEQQAREKRNRESYISTNSKKRKLPGQGTRQEPGASCVNDLHVGHTNDIWLPTRGGGEVPNATADPQKLLQMFIHEIRLDPSSAEKATKITDGPSEGECRVLTVTVSARGQLALHETSVFKSAERLSEQLHTKPDGRPYLKSGRHGPHGAFEHDPDRATGRGHDYEPEDSRKFATYMETRSEAGKKNFGGEPMFPDAVQRLRELEPWYIEYMKQYPGVRLDQWPCGCLKQVDGAGDESEEE